MSYVRNFKASGRLKRISKFVLTWFLIFKRTSRVTINDNDLIFRAPFVPVHIMCNSKHVTESLNLWPHLGDGVSQTRPESQIVPVIFFLERFDSRFKRFHSKTKPKLHLLHTYIHVGTSGIDLLLLLPCEIIDIYCRARFLKGPNMRSTSLRCVCGDTSVET